MKKYTYLLNTAEITITEGDGVTQLLLLVAPVAAAHAHMWWEALSAGRQPVLPRAHRHRQRRGRAEDGPWPLVGKTWSRAVRRLVIHSHRSRRVRRQSVQLGTFSRLDLHRFGYYACVRASYSHLRYTHTLVKEC